MPENTILISIASLSVRHVCSADGKCILAHYVFIMVSKAGRQPASNEKFKWPGHDHLIECAKNSRHSNFHVNFAIWWVLFKTCQIWMNLNKKTQCRRTPCKFQLLHACSTYQFCQREMYLGTFYLLTIVSPATQTSQLAWRCLHGMTQCSKIVIWIFMSIS